MFDNEDSETIAPYAANPVAATLLSSKNQMRRMYPTVNLDEHAESVLPIILDRTVHYMVHLDQTFDMNSIYDQDHFDKMKDEAFAYLAWLDTPDGTPYPSILKYSSSINTLEDDEASASVVQASPAKVHDDAEKIRAPSKNSKYQKALAMYHEDQANNVSRAVTVARMISELDMNKNTANVYYSKFKNPVAPQ